jgi:hypothetical protein
MSKTDVQLITSTGGGATPFIVPLLQHGIVRADDPTAQSMINNQLNVGLSGLDIMRALIRFDIPNMDSTTVFTEVLLHLYTQNLTGTPTIGMHYIYYDWSKEHVSWTAASSQYNWSTAGMEAATDYDDVAFQTFVPPASGDFTVDITAIVNALFFNGWSNVFNIAFLSTNEATEALWSTEGAPGSHVPFLEITP